MAAHDSAATPSEGITSTPGAGAPAYPTPADSTAIQPDSDRILLPPPPLAKPSGMSPERLAAWATRMDVLLGGLALLLAFLLGSFAIRNSDFFLYLASGRDLLQGKYSFGVDPYAHTTAGVYYINHSWLFDVALYGIYQLSGGVGVAIARAVLVTVLAALLLQIRRPGGTLWAPAACTGLAFLAISTRLLIQPATASLLFLGLTFFLLHYRNEEYDVAETSRSERRRSTRAARPTRHLWALPALFAVWANVDAWFLLGPALVLLYWLGEMAQPILAVGQPEQTAAPARRRTLALVFVVGVVACMANPHGARVFYPLPAQLPLGPAADALQNDPFFKSIYVSPLDLDYWKQPNLGLNVAALAYLPLVILCLTSFVLNLTGWRWWRATVFVGFLFLSIYHARAIPFFAVIAGPIAALNLQDFAARRFGAAWPVDGPWKVVLLGGRAVTLLLGLAIGAAAWPGWLHANPGVPTSARRVAWKLESDPSLEEAARQLAAWRKEGKLGPDDRGFNFVPDTANYGAWFAPEEKSFFDYRFQLYPEVAREYSDVRRALNLEKVVSVPGRPDDIAPDPVWEKVLRSHGVNHVIIMRPQGQTAFRLLSSQPDQWDLLHLGGRVAVFGWRQAQPTAPDRFNNIRLALEPRAFGPHPEQAPAEAPRPPLEHSWWQPFLQTPAPLSPDSDESLLYQLYFEAQSHLYQRKVLDRWNALYVADLVAAAGSGASALGISGTDAQPLNLLTRVVFEGRFHGVGAEGFFNSQDNGPPAAAWLAVRAGRRAVAANPNDFNAHFRLAHAYTTLQQNTRQRQWSNMRSWRLLASLQQAQIVASLQHALLLEPDSLAVHYQLRMMLGQANFRDLALKHLKREFELTKAAGPQAGEKADDFNHRVSELEKLYRELDSDVKNRLNEYTVTAANMQVLQKAQLALSKELGEKALQVLLDSDPIQFDIPGVLLELDLLLRMGRLEQVTQMIDEVSDLEQILGQSGFPATTYELLVLRVAAAAGDYQKADAALATAMEKTNKDPRLANQLQNLGVVVGEAGRDKLGVRELAALAIGSRVLENGVLGRSIHMQAQTHMHLQGFPMELAQFVGNSLVQLADLVALRGYLALEQGDTQKAAELFRETLSYNVGTASRSAAEYYLGVIEAQRSK